MMYVPVDLGGQVSDFENIVNMIMGTNIIITCETKGDIWS